MNCGLLQCAYLFASLRDENYNEFKNSRIKVIMNPWIKKQCRSLAEQLGLEDDVKWFHKYNLVGEKTRYLFSSAASLEDPVKATWRNRFLIVLERHSS